MTKKGCRYKPKANEDVSRSHPTSFNLRPDKPWEDLTINELKPYLKGRNLHVSGRKHELIKRLRDYEGTAALSNKTPERSIVAAASGGTAAVGSNTKQAPSWQYSKAKAILLKLYMDDRSKVYQMEPDTIYKSHPEFQKYPIVRFKDNLINLQKSVKKRKEIIARNERDFLEDQLNFLRSEKTSRGELFWDTHPANLLLQEDVKSGYANQLKPKDLSKTRKEYQAFSLGVFCKHVHQEKRNQREKPYWIPERNKKGLKKHQEEAAVKGEWDTRHLGEDMK